MTHSVWRQLVSRAGQAALSTVGPPLHRLWENALFSRERQSRPLPRQVLTWVIPSASAVMALLPVAAWVFDSRLVSAFVLGSCLAAEAILALASPVLGAATVPTAREQSTFTAVSPAEAAQGAVLIALWRLRWLIAVSLALTPALMISLLRLDVATFSAYRESVLALGSAAPEEQVRLLLPGGGIPFFRLAIREISGGLLLWSTLPVGTALGMAGAILLDDVTFGQLAGLISTVAVLLVCAPVWAWLSLTPIFAGVLEMVRLILLAGLLVALVWLGGRVTQNNARLLLMR